MDIICLDTNILIAHKRAKKAEKDKTLLYPPYHASLSFGKSHVGLVVIYDWHSRHKPLHAQTLDYGKVFGVGGQHNKAMIEGSSRNQRIGQLQSTR